MKRVWFGVAVLCLYLPASVFGQNVLSDGYNSLTFVTKNVKVNPYAQVGFQKVGSNLNLPVQNEALTSFLNIGELDVTLKDGNFWTGIAGWGYPLDSGDHKM
ncbi:MAG: hypothetical protein AB1646_25375 [Thermodesulfobacteriota bacterium]